ncbi:MAG: hypothetical protein GY719_41925 [bacterium]|nr:hypothetical protein [bacterium]
MQITPIQFFQALFPEPIGPGQLVLWTKACRKGGKHAYWLDNLDQAARKARDLRNTRDVYFGVCLQNLEAALGIAQALRPRATKRMVRGSADSATLLGALWADIDIAGPGHSRTDLPPDLAAALGVLAAVALKPSIIIDSGGGLHVYWLLREPWILATPEDRARARALVARLQAALRAAAQEHGWWVDETSSLAQLLRVPGTINHKESLSRDVTALQFPLGAQLDEVRYEREQFEVFPEPPAASDVAAQSLARLAGTRDYGPPSELLLIWEGCSWVVWAYLNRARLSEPEWFALLTIIVRCRVGAADGSRLCHLASRDHPGYSVDRTDAKIEHALDAAGPRTCAKIGELPGAYRDHCSKCPLRGHVKSPIVLGRRPRLPAAERAGAVPPPPEILEAGGETQPVEIVAGAAAAAELAAAPPGGAPEILISTREHEVNDRALAALAAGESNLYQRGGVLVQVMGLEARSEESALIRIVAEPRLRELLSRHCTFVKPAGDGYRPAHPPRWAVRALLGRGTWPAVSALDGVVEGPVLRRDGSVLQEPGYDPATRLVYRPGEEFEPVPESPDSAQLEHAMAQLREAVCDFPFRAEAHYSAWLSSVLTPLARPAFSGPSPLNLIDANVRGSGKSLLADVCSVLLTGRVAARMSYSHEEEELRKQITGLALQGVRLVLIDNVAGSFGCSTLDRALTAESWSDRLLGSNEQVSVPLEITWYATGNNVVLRGDTPRRCLHVRLEAPQERPERRSGFRHPRLLAWLRGERRRLLPAALTLLRGYAAAGSPAQKLSGWGSYEGWSDVVRATLVWLGLPDPADTRDDLEATADAEEGTLLDLVHGLAELLEVFGGAASSKEILEELAAEHSAGRFTKLRSALADLFPQLERHRLPTPAQLSTQLGAVRGRLAGRAFVEQGARSYKGVRWSVKTRRAREVA